MNPWSSGVLCFNEYIENSFLIVVNLERMKITNGALQLKLKFKELLSEKQMLLWMPAYKRKLVFDKNLDVTLD
jgi:hypothetical protein